MARDLHSFVKHATYVVFNRISSKLAIRILMNLAVSMSALASLKRNWIWAGFVLLCVLIAAATFVAPARIGKMELRYEAKVAAREERDGKEKGPHPKPPSGTQRQDEQCNLTDADSRLMRRSMREGFQQAYNAQACVDAEGSLLVLSARISQCP